VTQDLLCFSHLRWDFVYQRPNHLMARAARDRRVYFVEEPVFSPGSSPSTSTADRGGVTVVTPHLPTGVAEAAMNRHLAELMDALVLTESIRRPTLWYYTPMAMPWTRHLEAGAVVYDSMDYLAGFLGAPPDLRRLEQELLRRAELVFCGGVSLHERMQRLHPSAYCFPSTVDVEHFGQAREGLPEPEDQRWIGRPRIGYAGVLDERIDLELIAALASERPDWQIVLLGPVAKIDPLGLPRHGNIHYLGLKPYRDLPAYFGGWDVGWMPFARNAATRYISPTKTPEYLAAGLPVISTSIHDVVDMFGRVGLAAIADDVEGTSEAVSRVLAGHRPAPERVDALLVSRSWDRTWGAMSSLVAAVERRILATRAARTDPPATAASRSGIRPTVRARSSSYAGAGMRSGEASE
jgi:UDP-galactopyranose mutase